MDKKDTELTAIADTLWGEARGEYPKPNGGLASFLAIGNVIQNRLLTGKWGTRYEDVVKAPLQFSCWNKNDPNCKLLKEGKQNDDLTVYSKCLEVANHIKSGNALDITNGALNYYSKIIAPPKWSLSMICTFIIGNHIFFKPAK